MNIGSATLFILVVLIVPAASAQPASEAPITTLTEPPEEDIRIFEVVLDGFVLSEALVGYATSGGGTMLPLGLMSELLDIAITADPAEGMASGFILNERRTFHLDAGRRQVTIEGKVKRYPEALVRLYPDDIYVDSSLLSEWLPVAFDIDLFALRIRARPREPLPIQLRMERERRIRHWRLRLPAPDRGYPRLRTGFRLWDTPFIDQTLRLSLGEGKSEASYSTYATGDLLFMESEAYLAGSDDDPFDAARLTLRRRDPSATVGGWLHATEVAIGHISYPTSHLLTSTSAPAPGLLVTNFPLQRPAEFDRHTFRGNLPPGWDVELYHNGALIDYTSARPNGEYVFENVPILFGMNFFRLIFYGPQGQQREETHRFFLGQSLTQPGQLEYRLAANVESEDDRRASLLLSYGASRHVTAVMEAGSIAPLGSDQPYVKAGLRGFWRSLFAYGDYITQGEQAHAWETGLQTRLLGANLLLSRSELSDAFVSEVFQSVGDRLVIRDRARIDTAIPAWILPRIATSVELERDEFASGMTRTIVQNRLSSHYKGLSLANRFRWTENSAGPSRLEGSFQISRSIRTIRVRGELLYSLNPGGLSAANLTLERYFLGGYRFHANVTRSFLSSAHVYSIGIDKTTGTFAAGVEAMRTANGTMGANLNLFAGLGHEPREDRWIPDAQHKASSGALSVRVYLDQNYNGRFDPGDEPLPGVAVTLNGVERPQRTDAKGIAFVPEIAAHQPADVAISTATLEDPLWISNEPGIRIVPRPGKAAMIDFAIVETAEIEGTAHRFLDAGRVPAAGVVIDLVDEQGTVAQTTKAAYDGFYLFSQVRPGRYTVRAESREGVQLAAGPQTRNVIVKRGESLVAGVDLDIGAPPLPQEPAPSVAVAESVSPAPPSPVAESVSPAPPSPAPSLGQAARSAGEGYAVQLGTFSVASNARRLAESVRAIAPDAAVIEAGRYHIVRTGWRTKAEAAELRQTLAARGIEAVTVRLPDRVATAEETPSDRLLRTATAPSPRGYAVQLGTFAVAANANNLAESVRDLASDVSVLRHGKYHIVRTEPLTRPEAVILLRSITARGIDAVIVPVPVTATAGRGSAPAGSGGRFVVQLGAFSIVANATDLLDRAMRRGIRRAVIERRGNLYFVEAGRFGTRESADRAQAEIERAGMEAIVRSAPVSGN